MYDIIYFVKESKTNEELLYSLRSVEKNFPNSRVWIFGGQPVNIIPNIHIQCPQLGTNKWQKVRGMFQQALSWLPDNFILFNDDFFLMEPYTPKTYANGTLEDLCADIEQKYSGRTGYTNNLRQTISTLKRMGLPIRNFELHVPMPMEREKLELILKKFPKVHGLRSLYGNYFKIKAIEHADVKIHDLDKAPNGNEDMLSSSDHSWSYGKMGPYLRKAFPKSSRYELNEES